MRQSFTAAIERNTTFTADFETEPYEAGWATEARWFIRVLEVFGQQVGLTLRAQVSPDGLHWCDEGTALHLGRHVVGHDDRGDPIWDGTSLEPGLHSFPLREFGSWLRLRGELHGASPGVKVLIHLALKE